MRVLYLDSLFWLELTADMVLLWAAGKLCGCRRRGLSLLLAGLTGSGYTILALFVPPAASLAGKAASLTLMLLIAYGGEKALWRPALAYLFLCAVYGGVAAAVICAAGRPTARALVFSAGISLGVCALPFRFTGPRGGVSELRLVGQGGEVTVKALRDTGNKLSDPFSGKPVIISSEMELLPLFTREQQRLLNATRELPPEERMALLGKGFCLIPLRTVSGSTLALCGKADAVYQDGQALGPCRVVFSREPIAGGGCTGVIGGDGI